MWKHTFLISLFLLGLMVNENGNLAIPGPDNALAQTIDGIIAPESTLEKISGDIMFVSANSLCWDNGVLYFTDVNVASPRESRTYRMASDGNIKVIQENNGIIVSIRSSGKGTYYCSELSNHRIIEMDGAGKVLSMVADNYKGTAFQGPIDIVMDAKGGMYFADSQYYVTAFNYIDTLTHVFYRTLDGQIMMVNENGYCSYSLALSPDGAVLYRATIGGEDAGKTLYAHAIQPDGSLKDQRKFGSLVLSNLNDVLDITWKTTVCKVANPASSGASGMAVDSAGNVYVATSQGLGIQVFSPSGVHIGNIGVALEANDCCFGGPDMKTLFIAAKEGIYSIRTQMAGTGIALGN